MRDAIKCLIMRSMALLTALFFIVTVSHAQTQVVQGTVVDETGEPLTGATVIVKKSTKGVLTDLDGNFKIDVSPSDVLVFSFIGMQNQEVSVGNNTSIKVVLKNKGNEFDEVTVVAFAKQKKESVISAVSTVVPGELKVPSSNLTTALAGRMAGLIAFQQSGEPGRDNAQFFIRGVTTFGYKTNPLILIDNIELTVDDLARLNVDDIAQFSIMKDATATALYGARGANGVIIVTTKEGQEGKVKVNARLEHSISRPTKMVKLADPITYMLLNNEAINTRRDPLRPSDMNAMSFSQEKIENTIAGTNPYVYPSVDWYDELFKDETTTQRLNLNISGGAKTVRYYIAGAFTKDNGVLKNDKLNNYNSNIDLKKYSVRSNINIDLTNTTEAVLRINGTFDDYIGPLNGGDQLFGKTMRTSPVLYPKTFPAVGEYAGSTHILFGNSSNAKYLNPYADMVKGYKESNRTLISAQMEVKQKFDFLAKGLEARLLGNTTRYSYNDLWRYSVPFEYEVSLYDRATNTYSLEPINTNGEEYLKYEPTSKDMTTTNNMEASVSYNATFADKHAVSGMLVYLAQERKVSNAGSLQLSLPYRNQGLSGRFTYAYDSRYFTEFNFGYNGSERFAKNEQYGFFPAVGVGYIISNESFWKPLIEKTKIDKLKLKLTYGLVGNDAIGEDKDRFFYLSELNMNDGGRGQYFGSQYDYFVNGISMSRYANPYITWEKSKKTNLGIELGMFNGALDLQTDLFYEYRTNILQDRAYIPSTMGLSAGVKANIGEASSRGIDISLNYSFFAGKDFWLKSMNNFTYATGKFEVYEEPDFAGQGRPWSSRIGQSLSYNFGYVAERLFIDEEDIANSPTQTFGKYQAGDIKYKDINGDGKITSADQVFMGFPHRPDITYGFGVSAGYKDFDLSMFFQGNARVSVFFEPRKIAPFIDGLTDGEKDGLGMGREVTAVNNLLSVIADDHWSEDNRNIYAFWPRLSPTLSENNNQISSWWMRDASFLRLKTVELGYNLPKRIATKLHMQSARIYLTGNNLLTFSKFKLWDPEMGNNGLGYPIQKVYNIGLSINF